MLVNVVVGFDVLSINEMVSSHVLVSAAQVVVMVLQSSPKDTLVVFVIEVLGFDMFVKAIVSEN